MQSCDESFNTLLGASVMFHLDDYSFINNGSNVEWERNLKRIAHIKNGTVFNGSLPSHRIYQLYENGTLEIKNIQNEDHGKYVSRIRDETGKIHSSTYCLFVYEPVDSLIINHSQKSGTYGHLTCNITLECSTGKGTNVTFSWNKTPADTGSISVHNGSIFHDVEVTNVTIAYTCEARNPVSSRSASVNITASCHENKPGFFWILSAAGAGGILILAVILVFCYCKRKQKNSRRDDINTYYDTIPNNKADGIQTTPPDGSISVYATVQDMDLTPSPLKKKNDCVTVYSTVSSVKTKPATKAQKSNQPLTVYATVESVKKKRHSKILQSPTSVTIYEEVKVPESQKDMSHYEK
ncbi:signaling lymphocytic activation molecule-like isoform X1 [Protopterus annectens]|uniref:signaling lymphocytic activation molecule-like isoform X1 n=1 Tax=Protopterus annectens TaxID=7888 RepID=UPI001CF9534B|nr:signaling lymphocytic activation molecule-like isoform X1 [Protopterus annectens]